MDWGQRTTSRQGSWTDSVSAEVDTESDPTDQVKKRRRLVSQAQLPLGRAFLTLLTQCHRSLTHANTVCHSHKWSERREMVVGPFGSSDQPRKYPTVFKRTLEVMPSATRIVARYLHYVCVRTFPERSRYLRCKVAVASLLRCFRQVAQLDTQIKGYISSVMAGETAEHSIDNEKFYSAESLMEALDLHRGDWAPNSVWESPWIFRGQRDAYWDLVPKAWRKSNIPELERLGTLKRRAWQDNKPQLIERFEAAGMDFGVEYDTPYLELYGQARAEFQLVLEFSPEVSSISGEVHPDRPCRWACVL